MTRRTVLTDVADKEVLHVRRKFEQRSLDQADEFLSQVRVTIRAVAEQPFLKAIHRRIDGMEVRRARIARFSYWLFYFVYPSVDPQTGETLDVI